MSRQRAQVGEEEEEEEEEEEKVRQMLRKSTLIINEFAHKSPHLPYLAVEHMVYITGNDGWTVAHCTL
nr:unnamed protein product [Spirometra erinaceieuropaei]